MNRYDFCMARIRDLEQWTLENFYTREPIFNILRSMTESQKKIIQLARSWPTLVESNPEFTLSKTEDLDSIHYQISQRINQQFDLVVAERYEAMFGKEPPTASFVREFLKQFRNHPDFQREWLD